MSKQRATRPGVLGDDPSLDHAATLVQEYTRKLLALNKRIRAVRNEFLAEKQSRLKKDATPPYTPARSPEEHQIRIDLVESFRSRHEECTRYAQKVLPQATKLAQHVSQLISHGTSQTLVKIELALRLAELESWIEGAKALANSHNHFHIDVPSREVPTSGMAAPPPAVFYNSGSGVELSTALEGVAYITDGTGGSPTTLTIIGGGSVVDAVVQGSSRMHLAGGSARNITAHGSSLVTLVPRRDAHEMTAERLSAHDSSTLTISPNGEGSGQPLYLGQIYAHDSSTVVSNGAEVGGIFTYGASRLTVNLLHIHHGVETYDDSVVELHGPGFSGSGGSIKTFGRSKLTLRATYAHAPSLITLVTNDHSIVTIEGAFDSADGEISVRSGQLVGTLANGATVNIEFVRNGDSKIIVPRNQ